MEDRLQEEIDKYRKLLIDDLRGELLSPARKLEVMEILKSLLYVQSGWRYNAKEIDAVEVTI